MAVVTYCIITTATGECTAKFQWDDTYTYTPAAGSSIAPNANGEIGWTWNGSTWTYASSTPAAGTANPLALSQQIDDLYGLIYTGDMLYADADDSITNLPVGNDGEVLKVSFGVPTWSPVDTALIFIIDGGGSAITTGIKGDIVLPFDCTVTEWTLLADQTGDIVVDIWAANISVFPPTVSDTITGSEIPEIISDTNAYNTTLSGWTTSLFTGDVLRFNVDSASTVQRVTVSLKVTRA